MMMRQLLFDTLVLVIVAQCAQAGKPKRTACIVQREMTFGQPEYVFVPECEANGDYKKIQCHLNHCFCVNPKDGERIAEINQEGNCETRRKNTRKPSNAGKPKRTACIVQREMTFGQPEYVFVPECEANGDYKKKQCHGKHCFCVNPKDGERIGRIFLEGNCETPRKNTRKPSTGNPGKLETPEKSFCRIQREEALTGSSSENQFVPECEANGDYKKKQCNGVQCYCVNPNGLRVGRTNKDGNCD